MIDSILAACREVLEINGEPQSPYWLPSQMMEMKMWRASEHDVRAAIENDIKERGEQSLFVKVSKADKNECERVIFLNLGKRLTND